MSVRGPNRECFSGLSSDIVDMLTIDFFIGNT